MHKKIEKFWLYVCILYAIFLIYEYIFDKIEIANFYLLAFSIPLIMYVFRRFMRKKNEKIEQMKKVNKKSRKN